MPAGKGHASEAAAFPKQPAQATEAGFCIGASEMEFRQITPSQLVTVANGSQSRESLDVIFRTVGETPSRLFWWDGEKHVPLLSYDDASATQALVSGAGITPHPRYWHHGVAVGQTPDDAVLYDRTGGNHGVLGANLSKAAAWANLAGGYITTVDPASGVTESKIQIPGPQWSYLAGESLLVMWAGQCTPEGSDAPMMGTSAGTAQKGISVRATAAGRLQFALYDGASSYFSSTSTNSAAGMPFVSAERHSFAVFVDAVNRLQYIYVDGVINVSGLTLSSGAAADTLSSAPWSIGGAAPNSSGTGATSGVVTKTQAFAGLKFPAVELPSVDSVAAVAAAFHRNPGALIRAGAL